MPDFLPQSRVAPLHDLATLDWATAHHRLCLDGLTVELGVQSPYQIETVFISHILGLLISHENCQEVMQIDDRKYYGTFPKGTGFLSPANAHHVSAWRSTDTGVNFILDSSALMQMAEQTFGLTQNRVELRCTPFIQDAQLSAIATLFQHEIETGGMGGQLYAESLRNLLSLHLLRHYCVFSPSDRHPNGGLSAIQLRQVLDYIEMHLEQPLHLATLAQIVNLSEFHFSRLFKQSIGSAPHQYVLGRRVERAKYLLQQPQTNVLEVALACGFAHSSHLSRHFKRLIGVTPKQFQQQ